MQQARKASPIIHSGPGALFGRSTLKTFFIWLLDTCPFCLTVPQSILLFVSPTPIVIFTEILKVINKNVHSLLTFKTDV